MLLISAWLKPVIDTRPMLLVLAWLKRCPDTQPKRSGLRTVLQTLVSWRALRLLALALPTVFVCQIREAVGELLG
jgi:hypothetical protein